MRSGIDPTAVDPNVRPQDDLFAHVNGPWVRATPIPADRGRYGTFDELRETAEQHVREIIEEVAAGDPQSGTVAAKVGDLYASFMDEDAVEALGSQPLAQDLARAAAVSSPDEVMATSGTFGRAGILGLVMPFVNTDDRDPSRYVVYLEQAGLGLPDESYYREEQHADKRAAYVGHVERMLALAGWPAPAEAAARVMALETRLAAGHWDKVTNRDPVKTYTLLDLAGLTDLGPQITWSAYLDGLGAPANAFDAVVVRQPDHITSVSAALTQEPMQAWRDWLAWHVVHAHAPYLSSAFVEENFDFYGRTLSGVPEMRERWKRGVGLVEEALGEAVGQLYVERHFPPHAKEAMVGLVDNLVEAFRRSLSQVPWMGEDTRREALTKLGQFTPKIGYPQRWRDYGALEVRADDLLGNVRRAVAFEVDRQYAKLGGPVDRDEWFMTPQTVNAYYNPGLNEIVFPAAILQPPFFDVDADDAVNYGGIGAVIGHEVGHGFDDQGSQFDGTGTLRNWWTEHDRSAFQALADALIAQFDELETRDAPGHKVNGALTVGENIGDLGGLTIGHLAYRISLGDEPAPEIDGWTGDQRFFLGWAQVWRGAARAAEAERLLALDPHAPMDLRANAVRNLDEFHEAFGVSPGDGLWVDPSDRVRIF
ncbi:MAG TPA: M13-type metalloendopeptidase [Ornithinibacter sp.]|uniref:M13 family metallopeptidase n=1 Tax=Ornithinibacter sp. TaxID=2862748 RepID=UPI002B8F5999|nr:M13-type metalloendopeptidase [Ornithinibacter sp.]HQV82417.1 M13-type metalloendopeptidase [Ornithinibacter sp.]HQW72602.1 M13-type metalloendopeptidase [Ornithinibacter sp.]HQX87094.1 M13-type metalloendopeptidase [Ornithinibacter sp.]HRA26219.1 M13-type metalloendopeptidase [Ornithinibacter sp.]